MKKTIRRDSTIVVQANWMKEAVSSKLQIPLSQIHVIGPEVKSLAKLGIKYATHVSYRLFYPAVPGISYKNHELLIRMLLIMKKKTPQLYSRTKLTFTCKPDDRKLTKYYYRLSKKLSVDDRIEWRGYLSKHDMIKEYYESDVVVFPSKLETFGLPLIEAASLGKVILVLDRPYSRDVLGQYEGVFYLGEDPNEWVSTIEKISKHGIEKYAPLKNDVEGSWKRLIDLAFLATTNDIVHSDD